MWATEADDAGTLYVAALAVLAQRGASVAPRGAHTREIAPAGLTLCTPAHRVAAIHRRHLNPFLMLAEVLWILAGRDDVAFVQRFSRAITAFLPPGGSTVPDAYGPRLRRSAGADQIAAAVDVLHRDRDSRRALMSFWIPAVDGNPTASAVPCNIAVDMKLRDGGLHMTVFNRSNDVHIGLLFNLVQFGIIGEVVASRLGVPLVRQTHITTSLHVYTASAIHQRLGAQDIQSLPLYAYVPALPVGYIDDEMIAEACRRVDIRTPPDPMDPLAWCDASPWLATTVRLLDAHRAFELGHERDDFEVVLALLGRAARSDWWVLAAHMIMRRLHRRSGAGAARAREALASLVAPLGSEVVAFVMAGVSRATAAQAAGAQP